VYNKIICLSAGLAWGIVGVCASNGWAQEVLADGLGRGERMAPSSDSQGNSGEEFEIPGIKILIKGSTVFRRGDFAPIVEKIVKEVAADGGSNKDIATKLVREITELYLKQGYITSLTEKTRDEPEIEIQITEGKLSKIEIITNDESRKGKSKEQVPADGSSQKAEDGSQKCLSTRLRNYIKSRIQKGLQTPFNSTVLEEQLKLLRFDPMLSSLEADLKATGDKGLTNLTVRWCEASPFVLSASVDNYSPPSVGSERMGVELGYRNLSGLGDTLAGSYYRSTTGGSEVLDVNYQVPLNPMNGTLLLRYSPSRSRVTQVPFDELGIRGKQQVYELSYRQPIVRTLKEELSLSLGLVHQTGQTFLFDQFPNAFGIGPDENGVSRTSVLQFGQNYVNRDSQGLWGFRSQFNFGTGLFGVTKNENPVPDGLFFSWNGQVQRLQKLGDDHLLVVQADLQLTPESLLPSQQFTIGGAQSVRGFRQNQRSGDNGFRLLIEDRIMVYQEKDKEAGTDESRAASSKLGKTLQLVPFFNLGKVWNRSDNPNLLPRQNLLIGGGLGLLFEQPTNSGALTIRVDYGASFLRLDDRGNNAQDNGIYFSVRYQTR
jgi:hemolysin activation/secretion protein